MPSNFPDEIDTFGIAVDGEPILAEHHNDQSDAIMATQEYLLSSAEPSSKKATFSISGSPFGLSASAAFDITQRHLLRLPVTTTRWRLVIANKRPLNQDNGTAVGTFTGVWIGEPAYDATGDGRWNGAFTATPVKALDGFVVPAAGADYTTEWVTDPTMQFEADTAYMLSEGFTTTVGTVAYQGAPQSYWKLGAGASADAGVTAPSGMGFEYGWFYDIRVEYEAATDLPVGLFLGDSTTAGVGPSAAYYASGGEAFPEAAGLRYGFMAINAAMGSSRADGYVGNTRALGRFDLATYVPDFALVTLGVNETINNIALATYQANMRAIITSLRALGIPAIYLGTVLPINAAVVYDAARETLRQSYNTWIRQVPAGVTGIVDFDAELASSLGAATQWSGFVSSDSVHPMRAGYQRMAQAVGRLNLRAT